MPSPTGVSNLVRTKKKAKQGKRRKKESARKGTTNFMTQGFASERKSATAK